MSGDEVEDSVAGGDSFPGAPSLPSRGVGAHRGGIREAPENTLAAFRSAVSLGVHQIEFDLRRTADGEIVVLHDESVDRTTDGSGRLSELRFEEVRRLDAGRGERVPTLEEALGVLPRDVWINIQIKRGEPIAGDVARRLVEADRIDQSFVACGNAAGRELQQGHPSLQICNLARQASREAYLEHAVASGSAFIQFHYLRGPMESGLVARAHREGLKVNFVCSAKPSDSELLALFDTGVDFVLVDDPASALGVAARVGVLPRVGSRAGRWARRGSSAGSAPR